MLDLYWTPEARDSLDKLELFLITNFTTKEFEKALSLIENVIQTIRKGNIKFKYSPKTNTYKVFYHKRGSIYYQIDNSTLIILRIWDNRMMNNKTKLE